MDSLKSKTRGKYNGRVTKPTKNKTMAESAPKNITVTLKELYNYLSNNVTRDVNHDLGRYQTPQLYGTVDPNMPISTLK